MLARALAPSHARSFTTTTTTSTTTPAIGFFAVLRAVKASTLTATERLVVVTLASYADRDGVAWPGVARLARETGYQPRTVERTIVSLRAKGWLVWASAASPASTNLYTLTPPPPAERPTPDRGSVHPRHRDGRTPDRGSADLLRAIHPRTAESVRPADPTPPTSTTSTTSTGPTLSQVDDRPGEAAKGAEAPTTTRSTPPTSTTSTTLARVDDEHADTPPPSTTVAVASQASSPAPREAHETRAIRVDSCCTGISATTTTTSTTSTTTPKSTPVAAVLLARLRALVALASIAHPMIAERLAAELVTSGRSEAAGLRALAELDDHAALAAATGAALPRSALARMALSYVRNAREPERPTPPPVKRVARALGATDDGGTPLALSVTVDAAKGLLGLLAART